MKDLIIIGAGPGGFDTAIHAAEMGLDVTLIEKHKVGGTCLNYGCIPTKALYHISKKIKDMKELHVFGINTSDYSIDYNVIKERKESIVSHQITNILTSLEKLGVELIEGTAEIKSPGKVVVNGGIIEAKNIIIATGSIPKRLQFEGNDLPVVTDSKGILSLDVFPKKITIVGAGVIGCEMALIFNQLGAEITLVEYQDEILPPLDKDIKKRARNLYKRQGINIFTKSAFKKVYEKDGIYYSVFEQKGKTIETETDYVLLSTGRAPNFGGIDLDSLNIKHTNLGIEVNENLETSVKGIYAIGDVNGQLMLAHKATYDGYKALAHITNNQMDINFNLVPSVVFTFPEIAMVGKTEQEMTGDYQTNKYLFKTNAKAECLNETDGFVKMIVDENGILVGCHIIGAHASDMIHEVTTIMNTNITIKDYKNIIHAHPTISEVIGECIKGFH